ncbi:MAG: VWA domain-containing protein [Sedimentisphaerales bacterium]|nr:VWA domain-containing protein [Sedimentisphaerales bacterium]
MKNMIILMSLLLAAVTVCFAGSTDTVEHVAIVETPSVSTETTAEVTGIRPAKPLIQIAILLDTSGSMEGLIEQAKTELWSIVNEFIFAKRNGMEPEVQVSLYEYGKSSLARKDGFIRQIVPLTTDLDKISEELFALKTNGGDEYCGWVIQEATKLLQWSDSFNDLKVIFIAGNEPFTQGSVDYNKACKEAIAKGIIVNTIHCGTESEGISGHWKDGAVLADGRFLNIDHNSQVVQNNISAPQDKEIAELNLKLNGTYIAFGNKGAEGLQRQMAQDLNASSSSRGAAADRAVAKSSFNYINSNWDLVDALKDNKVDLDEIKKEDLPENMQTMTIDERKAYADAKATERVNIQKRIQELNAQRETYIQAELKKLAAVNQNAMMGGMGSRGSFGSAVTNTVREQAMQKSFSFSQPSPLPNQVNPGPSAP